MVALHRRLGVLALIGGCLGTAMCVGDFDTTRRPAQRGTLGEEVFRVVCERVDVSESPGDLDFSNARPVCTGQTAVDDGGTMAANVGPKVLALGARRDALAAALDRAMPNDLAESGQLDDLLVNMLPLYGTDTGVVRDGGTIRLPDGGRVPEEPDLLPQSTRAMANLLLSIADDNASVAALARISRHQGYRPAAVSLGMTRNVLNYGQLGTMLDHTLAVIGEGDADHPAGSAHDDFDTMLDVMRGELGAASPAPPQDQQSGTTLDAAIDLLFRTDPALASGKPRFLVRRDRFGMPRVARAASSSFAAPFVDANQDGVADSNEGQFVDAHGHPITVPSPFPANEAPDGRRDAQGRALAADGTPMYEYIDLDQTVLAALMRDSHALVDPQNNTALRMAHGASVLLGTRAAATHDYMLNHSCANGSASDGTCRVPPVHYRGFDASHNAPLVDTVHAAGIALTSRDLDAILQTVQALFTDHEPELARSTASLLQLNSVANMHPEATIDPRSNVWDDVTDVVRRIAQVPGLLEDVLAALGDPRTQQLGHAFAQYITYKDRIEPNWTGNLNASLASQSLHTMVDRTHPDTQSLSGGPTDNRSVFQRFLHLIHDLNGMRLCNKEGAYVRATSFLRWPLTGGYHRCELFQIDDAAILYLHAIAGDAQIHMEPGFLSWVQRTLGNGFVDNMLETNSGINGFVTGADSSHPLTPQALNRFVFEPDAQRTAFTSALVDPMDVVTRDGLTVRETHPRTLFALELYGFYSNVRPLVQAFTRHGDAASHLFVELMSAAHLHWATSQAGQYQSTTPCTTRSADGVCTNGHLYSTMDGAMRYEPILATTLDGDFMPATAALLQKLPMINAGSGLTGRDAIARLARMVFDPGALSGLAYRDGRTTTTRSDGTTPVPQPNLYYLFADAMAEIDTAFADSANSAQRDSWAAARSNLVDTFLAVDGSGTSARFHDRAIPTVSRLAVQWIRDRVAAHRQAGDLDGWARDVADRFAETSGGPAFASGLDLVLDLYNDVPTRAATGGLLLHLLDDTASDPNNPFGTTLTASADLVQTIRADADIDPLLHAFAPAFQRAMSSADGGAIREEAVPISVRMLTRIRQDDTRTVLDQVLANMVSRPASPPLAQEPLVVFGDSIAEVHRLQPGAGGPLSADDYREVFHQVADFFTDQSRGMEQFYYIVQHRRY